jgi:hypothetical protein
LELQVVSSFITIYATRRQCGYWNNRTIGKNYFKNSAAMKKTEVLFSFFDYSIAPETTSSAIIVLSTPLVMLACCPSTIISEAFPLITFGVAVAIIIRAVSVLYFDAPAPTGSKAKEVFSLLLSLRLRAYYLPFFYSMFLF